MGKSLEEKEVGGGEAIHSSQLCRQFPYFGVSRKKRNFPGE